MLKQKNFLLSLLIFSLLIFNSFLYAQEQITITTYYPSPYGSYNELGTNKLAVDIDDVAVPSEYAAMHNGDVHIGRSLIVGAGGGSGFAYDELVGPPDNRPNDGDVLIKGHVGIGTTGPSFGSLDVHSSTTQGAIGISGVSDVGQTYSGLYLHDDTADLTNTWYFTHINSLGAGSEDDLYIGRWVNPTTRISSIVIDSVTGNVGIGTTEPDEELHVVGSIKMVDGNQGAGRVLTSDANGVGSWQARLATWAGYTASTYTGNLGGVAGANALCHANYSGSHACTWAELSHLTDVFPGSEDAWVIDGNAYECYTSIAGITVCNRWVTCDNWTSSSMCCPCLLALNCGTYLNDTGPAIDIDMGHCSDPKKLPCCI